MPRTLLRPGWSSGGNTAGQPSDDGCYIRAAERIVWHGWLDQMPRSLRRGSLRGWRARVVGRRHLLRRIRRIVQVARGGAAREVDLAQGRTNVATRREAMRTARVETAARRQPRRIGDFAGHVEVHLHVGIRPGHRGEQRLGVGMKRLRKNIRRPPELHNPAGVHHGHPVAEMPDDIQVVRHEKEREPELLLQVLEQVEHLRLHGHVERRGSPRPRSPATAA